MWNCDTRFLERRSYQHVIVIFNFFFFCVTYTLWKKNNKTYCSTLVVTPGTVYNVSKSSSRCAFTLHIQYDFPHAALVILKTIYIRSIFSFWKLFDLSSINTTTFFSWYLAPFLSLHPFLNLITFSISRTHLNVFRWFVRLLCTRNYHLKSDPIGRPYDYSWDSGIGYQIKYNIAYACYDTTC